MSLNGNRRFVSGTTLSIHLFKNDDDGGVGWSEQHSAIIRPLITQPGFLSLANGLHFAALHLVKKGGLLIAEGERGSEIKSIYRRKLIKEEMNVIFIFFRGCIALKSALLSLHVFAICWCCPTYPKILSQRVAEQV